jgi:hypothetical protein
MEAIDWEKYEALVAEEMSLEERYLEFFNEQILPTLAHELDYPARAVYDMAVARAKEVRQGVLNAGSVRGLTFENIPVLSAQRVLWVRDGVPREEE